MTTDWVPQRDPQRQALPLHAAAEFAIRAADGVVSARKECRADGVGEGRHQGGATFEAGNGILLDRQRVQPGAKRCVCLRQVSSSGNSAPK